MKRSIAGICLTAVMAVIIGVVAIVGIETMDNCYYDAQRHYNEPLADLAKILEDTQRMQVLPRLALYAESEGAGGAVSVLRQQEERLKIFEQNMELFSYRIVNAEVYQRLDKAKDVYFNAYKPSFYTMMEQASWNENHDQLRELVAPMEVAANQMVASFTECQDIMFSAAQEAVYANDETVSYLLIIIVTLIVMELILSVIFLIAIAHYKHSRSPGYKNSYPSNAMPPVYAMYPVDPSNPANPPHATHIIYPVAYPFDPAQSGEPQKYQDSY